jgi:predicted ArsR family transcriptional regulator
MNDTPTPTTVHRALANEQRRQLVDELRGNVDGLDVNELARRLKLHPNTIRWHLGILADAGLATSRAEGRTTPGRPRRVYTLTEGPGLAQEESYRLLATILGSTIARLADGLPKAEAEGRAWGRYLVKPRPRHVQLTDGQAVQEVIEILAEQGFLPEVGDGEIRMRQCPFRELAEVDAGITCAVHRGLVSGALRALGSDLDVERLDAFVEPELCIARLRPSRRAESL